MFLFSIFLSLSADLCLRAPHGTACICFMESERDDLETSMFVRQDCQLDVSMNLQYT